MHLGENLSVCPVLLHVGWWAGEKERLKRGCLSSEARPKERLARAAAYFTRPKDFILPTPLLSTVDCHYGDTSFISIYCRRILGCNMGIVLWRKRLSAGSKGELVVGWNDVELRM